MAFRFLLVDALNLIRRVYAAQPGDDSPQRAEGAKVSCVQSLERALRESGPTHAVVVFEGPEPSWRHLLYRDYKAGHKPMPEALREALPDYRDAFGLIGVTSFSMPKVEADDVIGTLALKSAAGGGEVVILSTDKIFLQLTAGDLDRGAEGGSEGARAGAIAVRDHFGHRWLDRAHVRSKFGVEPAQFVDFLAMAGDSTNDIPGVKGIGPKTAAKLIADYGSLDAILAASGVEEASTDADAGQARASEAPPAGRQADLPPLSGKLADKLFDHAGDARLAQTLVRLQVDLDLGLNLKALRYTP